MSTLARRILVGLVVVLAIHATALIVSAQTRAPETPPGSSLSPTPAPSPPEEPYYLKDRGTGVSTSLFGTYIRRGELIFYPFFEYYRHNGFEYTPGELGSVGVQEFRGCYRAKESLIFFAYGLTEN